MRLPYYSYCFRQIVLRMTASCIVVRFASLTMPVGHFVSMRVWPRRLLVGVFNKSLVLFVQTAHYGVVGFIHSLSLVFYAFAFRIDGSVNG